MNIASELAQKRENDYQKEIKRLEAQLAADRKAIIKEAWDAARQLREREQYVKNLENVAIVNQDLKQQLAAANDALSGMTEHHANFAVRQERDEALKQLREQLDAEREAAKDSDRQLKLLIDQDQRQLIDVSAQLAAAVEALMKLAGDDSNSLDACYIAVDALTEIGIEED